MGNFGKCEQVVNDREIVLKENHSRLKFINASKADVRKIKVDDCLPIKGKKCDWLIITSGDVEHFVELKGNDVNHAVKQLENTMKNISTDYKKRKKHCFIACTRSPKTSTEIQCLKVLFKRKYNSNLYVKSRESEYTL